MEPPVSTASPLAARLGAALDAEGLGPVMVASPGEGPHSALVERIGKGEFGGLVLRVGEGDLPEALHILDAAERGPVALALVIVLADPDLGPPLLAAGATLVVGEEDEVSLPMLAREARARVERDVRVLGQARQFRSLAENLTETVIIVGEEGEIRYASPSFPEWGGVAPDEAMGRSAFDFILAEDREGAISSLRMVANDTHPPGPILFRVAADGPPYRVVEASGVNLLENPAVRGIVVSFRDVTERVQLEEQLRRAQKMEAVGRLAGGIAHDFNNILTALAGNAEMIFEDLGPGDPIRRDVEELRRGIHRASGLTSRLLGFSRRQIMIFEVVDLAEVVRGMEGLLARVLESHITLRIETPDSGAVRVDVNQLEQVILNLAINARDAMPTGGILRIRVERVTLDESDDALHSYRVKPGPYMRLSVSDTGEGMSLETQGRIFEPFFTTKPPGQGTGLGLAMAYGFVKQSLGYIWAESAPGRGATFRINLPLVPPIRESWQGTEHPPAST
ncbi:MAG: PAS domain S-box protein [Gemmatimonadales bacterium]|nr:MAG: PAS domain S-box protein [Gemmatimonadales bacterium]